MKKVFIVHGFKGKPNGSWRPWLMGELAKDDIYACALPMPSPNNPIPQEWVETISQAIGDPNDEIILVGHSLGVPAILRYLETLNVNISIRGVFLVSGVFHNISGEKYKAVNDFLTPSFNFNHIKKTSKKFIIIHGDDDLIVPLKDAKDYARNLSCDLLLISKGKHLSGGQGWFRLPQLLEEIKKII